MQSGGFCVKRIKTEINNGTWTRWARDEEGRKGGGGDDDELSAGGRRKKARPFLKAGREDDALLTVTA